MAFPLTVIALFVLLILGIPISISLLFSGTLGYMLTIGFQPGLTALGQGAFSDLNSFVIIAIPLYILMGQIMLKGEAGHDLFDFAQHILGQAPWRAGDRRNLPPAPSSPPSRAPRPPPRRPSARSASRRCWIAATTGAWPWARWPSPAPRHPDPAEHFLHSLFAGDRYLGRQAVSRRGAAGDHAGAAVRPSTRC